MSESTHPLMAACAEQGIPMDAAVVDSLETAAVGHPILQALLTWLKTLVAKTPALVPYLPTILADFKAGNWVAAMTLISEVLAGQTPTV